jgi:tetratricopeptide (TPR) repeat protein
VEADPDYADAWAGLCNMYVDEYRFNFNPRPDPLDRAFEAARRAVGLDPTSQWARQGLAAVHFFRHDLDMFLAEAERAISLNPSSPGALADLGAYLLYVGDERGIAMIRKAMALDPLHPTVLYTLVAHHHFDRGEYEEAVVAARKVDAPGFYYAQLLLAVIYAELDRPREARSALEELLRLWPELTTETLIEHWKKWNMVPETAPKWVAALRKAGLSE